MDDPTLEEIREACLRIQAGWTPHEEYRRRVTKPEGWEPPEISGLSGDGSEDCDSGVDRPHARGQ